MRVLVKHCIECNAEKSKKGEYCKSCSYKHRTRPSGLKYNIVVKNKGWIKEGNKPWNIGKRSDFKGETYAGLHDWVERNLGKPRECEFCGCTDKKVYQWSNKSGEYKAELSDWQRLCVKCHAKYDYENFGAREVFYVGGRPDYV